MHKSTSKSFVIMRGLFQLLGFSFLLWRSAQVWDRYKVILAWTASPAPGGIFVLIPLAILDVFFTLWDKIMRLIFQKRKSGSK